MNFFYPSFLWALGVISIPIIIHLFSFKRYKRIFFSDIHFLSEVKEQTNKQQKLKHLLILISRILFLIFLVLAFAQPFIGEEKKKTVTGTQAISIYIDNSFSMDGVSAKGRLLDQAVKWAEEIANAYQETDKFQILTNDFEAKHQHLLSRDEFLSQLQSVKLSAQSNSLDQIIGRQKSTLTSIETEGILNRKSFIISDFQENLFAKKISLQDSTIEFQLVPLETTTNDNIFIDSVFLETPYLIKNEANILLIKVCNKSKKELNNKPIKLVLNNIEVGLTNINASPGECVIAQIKFSPRSNGAQSGYVVIDDYPIVYDDKYYVSFNLTDTINTIILKGEHASSYPFSVFKNEKLISAKEMDCQQIDYKLLSKAHFIILNELNNIPTGLTEELKKALTDGKSILLIPSEKIELNNYYNAMKALNINPFAQLDTAKYLCKELNFENELYKDVFEKIKSTKNQRLDLPIAYHHYKIEAGLFSSKTNLMKLENDDDFLVKYNIGKGRFFVLTSSLLNSGSSFAKHALFVPTLYKMALTSYGIGDIAYNLAVENFIPIQNLNNNDKPLVLNSLDNKFSMIPEIKNFNNNKGILVHQMMSTAGNYTIRNENINAKELSFNYNRLESVQQCFNKSQIEKYLSELNFSQISVLDVVAGSPAYTLNKQINGIKLWLICIILSLLFLLTEILLIKFFKN